MWSVSLCGEQNQSIINDSQICLTLPQHKTLVKNIYFLYYNGFNQNMMIVAVISVLHYATNPLLFQLRAECYSAH